MDWEIAQQRNKKFKLFIQGPPGGFKTRTALRLANNKDFNEPAAAVIDTEFGTDHFADQFAMRRIQTNDTVEIYEKVKKLVKNPGKIRTLIFDSFSVYYDALMELWVDRFKLRELNSAGNKGEYYTFQPKDYVHVNRDAAKLVRMMLKCDLNIVCICQLKDKWEGMKVVGSIFDGWKRLPYYFDTIIGIEEVSKKTGNEWVAKVQQKDRSHSFKVGEVIPWANDQEAFDYMVKKMGQDLSGGALAASYDPDAPVAESVALAPETKSETKPVEVKAEVKAETPKETVAPVTAPAVTPTAPAETKTAPAPTVTSEVVMSPETTAIVNAAVAANETVLVDAPDVSGPATHETLQEVVRTKKEYKVNDKDKWNEFVAAYKDAAGKPHTSARDMTEAQAKELIKDIIRAHAKDPL